MAAGANAPARGKLNFIDPVTQGGERPAQAWGRGCVQPCEMTRPRSLPATLRLRGRSRGIVPCAYRQRCWKVRGLFRTCSIGSTGSSRQSDEPFRIRDVQFDDPQIAVLVLTAVAIVPEVLFVFSILLSGKGPGPAPVGLRHALVCCSAATLAATYDKQSAGVAFASCDHRGEA